MIAAAGRGRRGSSRTPATSRPPAGPPASCSTGCGPTDGRLLHTLQGRPGQVQRLPRRLRLPDRRPDPAVRGDRRAALDRGGARPGAGHDRRVRRPRAAAGSSTPGKSHEALIARQKDAYDNATPSGNAMAATALLRLAALTGRDDLTEAGPRRRSEAVQLVLEQAPMAAGQSLIALDFLLAPPREFAVDRRRRPRRVPRRPGGDLRAVPAPQGRRPGHRRRRRRARRELVPLLADRPARDGRDDDLHLRALRLPGAGRRRRGVERRARRPGGVVVTGRSGLFPCRRGCGLKLLRIAANPSSLRGGWHWANSACL